MGNNRGSLHIISPIGPHEAGFNPHLVSLYALTVAVVNCCFFIFTVQWEQNSGRCGICGDPYHLDLPRPHEAGGQYAKGIIGRHYSVGQVKYRISFCEFFIYNFIVVGN